ncbi:hypothetical protein KJ564_02620, partial [bacterium]|nr:hypothetical protein [bacterium]
MPFLNAVDDAELINDLGPEYPNGNILQNYVDYCAQQAYCGAGPQNEGRIDAYNSDIGWDQNVNGLRFGVENNFWSYYTEGLLDQFQWAGTYGSTWDSDYSPVYQDRDPHPFITYEWPYDIWLNEAAEAGRYHLTASQLSEHFSIDVYPNPQDDRDYYLNALDMQWPVGDPEQTKVHSNIARLLN